MVSESCLRHSAKCALLYLLLDVRDLCEEGVHRRGRLLASDSLHLVRARCTVGVGILPISASSLSRIGWLRLRLPVPLLRRRRLTVSLRRRLSVSLRSLSVLLAISDRLLLLLRWVRVIAVALVTTISTVTASTATTGLLRLKERMHVSPISLFNVCV